MREKGIAKVTQGFGLSKQADGEAFTETGRIRVMGEAAQDNKSVLDLLGVRAIRRKAGQPMEPQVWSPV